MIELQNKSINDSANYLLNKDTQIINSNTNNRNLNYFNNINNINNINNFNNLNSINNINNINNFNNVNNVNNVNDINGKHEPNVFRHYSQPVITYKKLPRSTHVNNIDMSNRELINSPITIISGREFRKHTSDNNTNNITSTKFKNRSVKKKNYILNNNDSDNSNNHELSPEIKQKIFDIIDKYQNQSQGTLEGSFFDAFRIRFCCCKQRFRILKKLYQQGEEELSKYIDYLDMIKTLQQNPKLKKTIFNNNQRDLFEHSFKPRIIFNPEEKTESKTLDSGQNDRLYYFTLYESYKQIQNKEKINEIDEKILNIFDDDLKIFSP